MSFLIQNQLDKTFVTRINQETRFLKYSKTDWPVEEVVRFASLIKIDESIGSIIECHGIDGEALFNLAFLSTHLELVIDQTKFLPIYKLFYVANAILNIDREVSPEVIEEQFKNSFSSKPQNDMALEDEPYIEIDENIIIKLKQELAKLNNMPIIELSSNQVYRMAKNIQLMNLIDEKEERLQDIRKWCVDGFSLICIVAVQNENPLIRNYYSDQDMNFLKTLSNIFIHLYYFQHVQSIHNQQALLAQSQNSNTLETFDFNELNFENEYNVKRSMGNSEYDILEENDIRASMVRGSVAGSAIRGSMACSVAGSAIGVSVAGSGIRGSVAGSAIRESILQTSERGSLTTSQYPVDERRSRIDSLANSVYASSEIMEGEEDYSSQATRDNTQKSKPQNIVTSSLSEDDTILKSLSTVALKLPFNLLNLQPLQKMKISTMSYPFLLGKTGLAKKQTGGSEKQQMITDNSSQKNETIYDWISENLEVNESKMFNLSGAKFGRSPENDFSYPDELSISGKHAQIVFKDQSYYLRDLGSKTGTYLFISSLKPLVLTDQQIIQLSYEVEIKVVIIKSDINEGVIKFQFKKPDNEPPYRAILKNNNTVRIGKAEKSHIRLTNQSISSYHAEIKYEQGKFVMYDCNTRTGTWLRLSSKGIRSADRKLSKNDIFRISSKKTFFIEDITESIVFQKNGTNQLG